MTAEKALSNIVSILENRINVYNEIQLPVIAAIRSTAAKFNGKVLNRRFTAAVTKALESNENHITVGFDVKWDGSTEYDIIKVSYRHNDKYNEFCIYPDRIQIKNYTNDAGRLVAEKLITTCNKYKGVIEANILEDQKAIERAAEFVARVEAVKNEIEAINKDFPLSLRARVGGNYDFRN